MVIEIIMMMFWVQGSFVTRKNAHKFNDAIIQILGNSSLNLILAHCYVNTLSSCVRDIELNSHSKVEQYKHRTFRSEDPSSAAIV